MADPRNNADDAYAAFMSMDEDEWQGCLRSILGGGVFQPAEQQGFERALVDRKPEGAMQEPRLLVGIGESECEMELVDYDGDIDGQGSDG